ncbi:MULTISPECIES: HlyD family secretion protein [unclassified Saccharibacter]|uniref:HlyD family secretion protein n=1 Tax=unclassified Saccharibacter TaxID=2648722 RepID=UPI00132A63A3|nr:MULTISPECIES: HlyD family secretion protein [unclassified Saccharibacter]MXV35112.1 HlyD family efflux transporter periplasmic adaptor subunit [Saccharibacter sp. EH611]MXV57341.1 HlyD family efflux transporter periplasmic adaptor subunit [Saccharibacter sp. EH70]MXV64798.1 HlyD family efflux transporter periplasmic adaptor subunit [Saccharibacter sp. EH60]
MKEPSASRKAYWPFFFAGGIIALFVIVILAIVFVPTSRVWTNDAYVTAHYAVIAPRVPGQVISVQVDDNQSVRAGDVLATLDPRDYQTTLDQARATEEHDRALVLDAAANVARQPSLIGQAQASVDRLKAELLFAQQNAARYEHLARTGAGSREEGQKTHATLGELTAGLHAAEADLSAAQAQLTVLEAQHDSARRQVAVDQARVHQAELNLSYTQIRAPFDGMVGERSVQAGNYVPDGAALMALVPMDQLWIAANYREIALRHMRPGQKATIHVDAYNIDLDGVVDSVPPASGAAFAPLAPENATGNFTKIVQRLPVKITLIPGQPLAKLLRLGFSVETTVHTSLSDVVGAQEKSDKAVTAK